MTIMRTIGHSDLQTPPLILGGNVFDWTADRETSFAVLDAFVAGGGRMIDTADVYSKWVEGHVGGESEAMIGAWLKRRGRRDDVMITTKVGMLAGEGGEGLAPSRIAAAIEASLRRLGTDYVDLYLAHQDDPAQDMGAVADAFDALVKEGKVRFIGASNFTEDRLTAAIDIQDEAGASRYVALQNKFNLLERDEYGAGLQQFCVENGIGVTPFYGLANGYLTGKYRTHEDLSASVRGGRVKAYMEGRGPAVLAALDAVAETHGATPAQIALAWVAAQPGIAAPIASATSVKQVEDLVGTIGLTLSADEVADLDAACRETEGA